MPSTWLTRVDRERAHLNAMRHMHTWLVQDVKDGAAHKQRFVDETEADIKATLIRLSDLGAF